MFDLKLISGAGQSGFNRQLPFFNWYYPFDEDHDILPNPALPWWATQDYPIRRRAVYLHVPFCDTVCSFCPFTRGQYQGTQVIQDYVDALLAELEMKKHFVGRCPVDVIFVGGGTPSVLSPEQIETIGDALRAHFDTSKLVEFSFELEVKTVTRAKLEAMQRIGVNRVSFGAQTFSPLQREVFALDATVQQVRDVAAMTTELFAYTNMDMIYGMAGQRLEDLYHDLHEALSLGTTTVDFYPLNNLAAQVRMLRKIKEAGLENLSATTRVQYRSELDRCLRQSEYSRINGYSYSRSQGSPGATIQHRPKFQYHDIVYGCHDEAVLGYGASALSQLPGYNLYNCADRAEYVARARAGSFTWRAFGLGDRREKDIVNFPYRGELNKSGIRWEDIPVETIAALHELVDAGFIIDTGHAYELTTRGWLFYVNLMYHLMPQKGKQWISNRIAARQALGHHCEETILEPISITQ